MDPLDPPRKYPGRLRVVSRQTARDLAYRRIADMPPPVFPCTSIVQLPAIGLPSMLEGGKAPLPITLEARCRQCEGCLKARRALWERRARAELKVAPRSWFGTLTVSPEERVKLGYLAERAKLRAGREALSSLDAADQFRLLASSLSVEVTKWLKRVRAMCGPFRYLLVFEAHKDGFPHVHLLLHESSAPIPKRKLEDQWRFGFSHWRLVDGSSTKEAYYVCKYLAKDALTRVRASHHYGSEQAILARLTERLSDTVNLAKAVERNSSPSKE